MNYRIRSDSPSTMSDFSWPGSTLPSLLPKATEMTCLWQRFPLLLLDSGSLISLFIIVFTNFVSVLWHGPKPHSVKMFTCKCLTWFKKSIQMIVLLILYSRWVWGHAGQHNCQWIWQSTDISLITYPSLVCSVHILCVVAIAITW